MARVQVINEVSEGAAAGEFNLCLQWCRYIYDDPEAEPEHGYRFIWRRPDGSLQAARGQARIPSKKRADGLWAKANAAGWDGHVAP